MKWSLFDDKNQATLDEVRGKYSVTAERLNELKSALAETKRKLTHGNLVQLQSQSEQRSQAITAFKKAVENTHFHSRKDVLTVFNNGTLKTKLRKLMQTGLNVAYVDAVSAKAGAPKVYKFEADKSGRIRLFVAIPDDPHEFESSGLYSVTVVGSTSNKASAKTTKARPHFTKAVAAIGTRKTRKPRIGFENAIKV